MDAVIQTDAFITISRVNKIVMKINIYDVKNVVAILLEFNWKSSVYTMT